MCGITGVFGEDKALVTQMTQLIAHRGPNGQGIYSNGDITFGHRRLSILDLSVAASQPMLSEDELVVLVFNGEIFNFKELRAQLESKGFFFSSTGDTEVLLNAYLAWGKQCVAKLRGQFAFAIWDDRSKELFLARDRFGIKPLYYYHDTERHEFLFASEIKSLLCNPHYERELNETAAYHFLSLRYVPGNETLFAGISQVPAGHTLTITRNPSNRVNSSNQANSSSEVAALSLKFTQYWDLPLLEQVGSKTSSIGSISQASRELRELLRSSVKDRLVADVPVGAYLSGGIDSSALVALASQEQQELNTFTVGFAEGYSELSHARKIADHFGTTHHEIEITGSIAQRLPQLVWHLDQPHGDPVIMAHFELSKLAQKSVTVVLSGEGADEQFAGYSQYKTFLLAQHAKILPLALRNSVLSKVPLKLYDSVTGYPASIGEKGKEKILDLAHSLSSPAKAYTENISILSRQDRRHILRFSRPQDDLVQRAYWQSETESSNKDSLLAQMQYYDSKTWLAQYVLFVADRMTMAHSIEGRVPFLDSRIASFAARVPASLKIHRGVRKFILRKAMAPMLPSMQQKHPFLMPLDSWYRSELKDVFEDIFSKTNVSRRAQLNHHYLSKINTQFSKSPLLYGKQLFSFLTFELWQRQFLDTPLKELLSKQSSMKLSDLRGKL